MWSITSVTSDRFDHASRLQKKKKLHMVEPRRETFEIVHEKNRISSRPPKDCI
jgi:hypothetical protein